MPTRHRIGIFFFFRRLSRSRSQTAVLRCRGKTHKKGTLVCQNTRTVVKDDVRLQSQNVGFCLLLARYQQLLPLLPPASLL